MTPGRALSLALLLAALLPLTALVWAEERRARRVAAAQAIGAAPAHHTPAVTAHSHTDEGDPDA